MKFQHLEKLKISAEFSNCGKFRYSLIVENPVSQGSKTLCVIMQNPSDADESIADKSVQFLEKLVFRKNYKVFQEVRKMIIVNQYAYIQKKGFLGTEEKIGSKNDPMICTAVQASDIVLIAWGKNNPYRARKLKILSLISEFDDIVVLKSSKHPSRGFYKDFVSKIELNEAVN